VKSRRFYRFGVEPRVHQQILHASLQEPTRPKWTRTIHEMSLVFSHCANDVLRPGEIILCELGHHIVSSNI
jgi:hypothetical protein